MNKNKKTYPERIKNPDPGDRGDKIHNDIHNDRNLTSKEKDRLIRELNTELARRGKKPTDPLN